MGNKRVTVMGFICMLLQMLSLSVGKGTIKK